MYFLTPANALSKAKRFNNQNNRPFDGTKFQKKKTYKIKRITKFTKNNKKSNIWLQA